jgi:hypothetical protein
MLPEVILGLSARQQLSELNDFPSTRIRNSTLQLAIHKIVKNELRLSISLPADSVQFQTTKDNIFTTEVKLKIEKVLNKHCHSGAFDGM